MAGDLQELVKSVGMTRRELDVLILLTDGHSNKEIARKLGLSVHTTKRHICRLFDRLDVTSRLQAATWYFKNVPDSRNSLDRSGVQRAQTGVQC